MATVGIVTTVIRKRNSTKLEREKNARAGYDTPPLKSYLPKALIGTATSVKVNRPILSPGFGETRKADTKSERPEQMLEAKVCFGR